MADLDLLIEVLTETLQDPVDLAGQRRKPKKPKRVRVFKRNAALRKLLILLRTHNKSSSSCYLFANSPTSSSSISPSPSNSLDLGLFMQLPMPSSSSSSSSSPSSSSLHSPELLEGSTSVHGDGAHEPKIVGNAFEVWNILREELKTEVASYLRSFRGSPNSSSAVPAFPVFSSVPPRIMSVSDRNIRIAYFPDPVKAKDDVDTGSPENYAQSVATTLSQCGICMQGITAEEIRLGRLNEEKFHVLLVPGGFVSNYSKALKESGKRAIIDFVRSGGGYVGICAGAFLGTQCASKKKRAGGLGLLPDVSVMDYEHWARGRSDDCVLRLQPAGIQMLVGGGLGGASSKQPLHLRQGDSVLTRYCNGPLLVVARQGQPATEVGLFPPLPLPFSPQNDQTPQRSSTEVVADFVSDFTSLASFGKKVSKPTGFAELPRGIMNKTSGIVRGFCGRGKVVLISPHLEDGEPLAKHLLRCSVRWSAGAPVGQAERARIDIPQNAQQMLRCSFLATRVPKYDERTTDEDKAQALAGLLPHEFVIPRATLF